jgi:hypothetical protein
VSKNGEGVSKQCNARQPALRADVPFYYIAGEPRHLVGTVTDGVQEPPRKHTRRKNVRQRSEVSSPVARLKQPQPHWLWYIALVPAAIIQRETVEATGKWISGVVSVCVLSNEPTWLSSVRA